MKASFRKRFFAWILKQGDSINHRIYGDYKKNIFHEVRGTVVEIGPGTGVNLLYLSSGIKWIGLEPNEAFHEVLRKKAKSLGIEAQLTAGDASAIPLPDQSADYVICTLVLCSVDNPTGVIAELKRVLKPGGKIIFIEHVAAPAKSTLRRIQNFSNPFNRAFADGCHCNRETWKYFEQAGFARLEFSNIMMKGTMPLHRPHIIGYAVK